MEPNTFVDEVGIKRVFMLLRVWWPTNIAVQYVVLLSLAVSRAVLTRLKKEKGVTAGCEYGKVGRTQVPPASRSQLLQGHHRNKSIRSG